MRSPSLVSFLTLKHKVNCFLKNSQFSRELSVALVSRKFKHVATSISEMKAIHVVDYGGPEVLKVVTVNKPQIGPDEVLVKVKAIGVNPVETYLREGSPFYPLKPLPFIVGNDFAGVIKEVGTDISSDSFKPNDRVFGVLRSGKGTYAQYIAVSVAKDLLATLPENASFSQGAACTSPYFTAYLALHKKGKLQAGQTVLVQGGSGGVGMAAVNIAAAAGATVIATAGTSAGENNAIACGAKHVFNHKDEGYVQKIQKVATESYNGVDLIIDTLGNVNLNNDIDIVKKGGIIVLAGVRGSIETKLRLFMTKEIILTGVMLASATMDELKAMAEDVQAKLSSETYKPTCIEYPFVEAANAHQEVIYPSKGGTQGKLILKVE